jgi:hypothetical protein
MQHNPGMPATQATAMVPFFFFSAVIAHSHASGMTTQTPEVIRQLASDDNSDGDDGNNNNDDDIDIDINNDDDDDIDIDIDNNDDDVDGSPGSDGNNLNDFGNKLEGSEEDQDDDNNSTSSRCGDKHPHSRAGSVYSWRKPVKVHATTGAKPKAGDYEIAVKKVLSEAIPLYRGYLCMGTPYPGPTEEMTWAKMSWKGACEECKTRMAPNDEIIKLVSAMPASANQHIVLTFSKDYQPRLALPWPDQNEGSVAC